MTVPTKEQILDAAEKLITERGIDAVSLRAITAAADVNLAAVHYHFGSKDALVHKVFERRIRPMNEERLRQLEAAEKAAGPGPLAVETVLRALIEPAMRVAAQHERGPQLMMMCGRIYAERSMAAQDAFDDLFREVVVRFREAFARALPELPPEELGWRVHFAAGVMVHTMMASDKLQRFSGGLCDPRDTAAAVERMIGFCAAGMRAGLPTAAGVEGSKIEVVQ